MLIPSRLIGETIVIDGDINVTVLGLKGNQVKLGIDAPDDVDIVREELLDRFGRISESGTKVGVDLRVTSTSAISGNARIEWTGARYGLTWHESGQAHLVHLDAAGTRMHAPLVLGAGACTGARPFPAWNGSGWLVGWEDCGLDEVGALTDTLEVNVVAPVYAIYLPVVLK